MDYAEVFKLPIKYLSDKWQYFKDSRFLKKHGCTSWEQYNRIFDPDINIRATEVKDYYCGYPYLHRFADRTHQIYDWDIWYSGWGIVESWAKTNCQDKFRFDALRVFPQNGIGLDGQSEKVWFINELGGGDYIYAAFKSQRDYTWFMLKWGS